MVLKGLKLSYMAYILNTICFLYKVGTVSQRRYVGLEDKFIHSLRPISLRYWERPVGYRYYLEIYSQMNSHFIRCNNMKIYFPPGIFYQNVYFHKITKTLFLQISVIFLFYYIFYFPMEEPFQSCLLFYFQNAQYFKIILWKFE